MSVPNAVEQPVAWLIERPEGTGKQQTVKREVVLSPLTDDTFMDEGDAAYPLYLQPNSESERNAVELTPERIDAMWKLAMKYVANTFFEYSFVPGSPRPTLPMVFADLLLQAASSARPNSEAQAVRVEVIGHPDQPVSARCCISGCQDLPDNRPNKQRIEGAFVPIPLLRELLACTVAYGWTDLTRQLHEAMDKGASSTPSAIEAQNRIDAEEACRDVFRDFDESEIKGEPRSVRIAWGVGAALDSMDRGTKDG